MHSIYIVDEKSIDTRKYSSCDKLSYNTLDTNLRKLLIIFIIIFFVILVVIIIDGYIPLFHLSPILVHVLIAVCHDVRKDTTPNDGNGHGEIPRGNIFGGRWRRWQRPFRWRS